MKKNLNNTEFVIYGSINNDNITYDCNLFNYQLNDNEFLSLKYDIRKATNDNPYPFIEVPLDKNRVPYIIQLYILNRKILNELMLDADFEAEDDNNPRDKTLEKAYDTFYQLKLDNINYSFDFEYVNGEIIGPRLNYTCVNGDDVYYSVTQDEGILLNLSEHDKNFILNSIISETPQQIIPLWKDFRDAMNKIKQ